MDPQTPPGGPQRGGRLTAWARKHKGATVALVVGAGAGILVLAKRGAAASSGAGATGSAPDTAGSSSGTPASMYGGGYDTTGYDASMQNLADALNNFTSSQSGGGGVSAGGSGGGSGGGRGPNPNAKSWTDTGQRWSLKQLAAALGVPLSALRASNALGAKGAVNPNAPLAKGASFTFLQTPGQQAAGKIPRPPVKPPVTVRKKPGKA
jgi:hypothetical protein